ncbi:hypothetical protein [Serratia fonticola]|jgi:hypothetical protein|uniref:Uncharacterized protein n=1 Tax=Serratia fonticola TaxID=47917 RepID=A0A0F7HA16_SERFO|nr:hypothetical protein [Serratia fonticola]AKG69056.1 hypothetical protein WN53_07875 [Serratia fonticola]CAI1802876.1 Uncharacterised protein [Serratia fonticola]CAI1969096.1 Uncharacterised protein [Serratia fonticola]VTR20194.1 Uncharacterised protein [Serratia fonticola]
MKSLLSAKMGIIAITVVILVIIGIRVGNKYYHERYFNCEANLIVHAKDARLDMSLAFYLQGDSGMAILKGTITKDNRVTSISRKNYFKINRNSAGYLNLVTTQAISSPSDEALTTDINHYLPDFYSMKDASMDYFVHKQGDAFVFSTGYLPSFYCVKN